MPQIGINRLNKDIIKHQNKFHMPLMNQFLSESFCHPSIVLLN